jgi:hypothetical protein
LDAEPGAILAAAAEDALAEGGVLDLSHDAVVALAAAAQRLLGWAMSVQCRAAAELARRTAETVEGTEGAVAELALGACQDFRVSGCSDSPCGVGLCRFPAPSWVPGAGVVRRG